MNRGEGWWDFATLKKNGERNQNRSRGSIRWGGGNKSVKECTAVDAGGKGADRSSTIDFLCESRGGGGDTRGFNPFQLRHGALLHEREIDIAQKGRMFERGAQRGPQHPLSRDAQGEHFKGFEEAEFAKLLPVDLDLH